MKASALFLGLFLLTFGRGSAAPFLTISTRDLGTMVRGSAKIAEAWEPGSSKKLKGGWFGELGGAITNGVNPALPWHHATFPRPGGGNLFGAWHAYYVPVTNHAAFVKALPDDRFKQRHSLHRSGDYAVLIWDDQRRQKLTAAEVGETIAWTKAAPRELEHDVSLVFTMDEQMRGLAGLGVMLARGVLAEQMKPAAQRDARVQTAMLLPGAYELLALQMDLATAIVQGTKQITITLDVEEDRLLFRDRIEAIPGSDFARLVRPAKCDLPSLIRRFDADTPVVVAAHIEGDGQLRKSFLKAMQDGSRAAGTAFDDQFRTEAEGLLNAMLPLSLAMGVDWRRNYRTTAVYEFAKRPAAGIQDRLLEFIPRLLNARGNVDQIYSHIEVRRNIREANKLRIDRLMAKLNPDSPVFVGRKETLAHIWPDGEVRLEFANRGPRMFYASGAPVDEAMRPARNPLTPLVSTGTNTVILARFNPVELMIQTMVNEPKPSLSTIQLLEVLDPDGAAIDARVDLDGGMSGEASVPLRLITELGKTVNQNRRAR